MNENQVTEMEMALEDVLMVKFYVVDGISLPACEVANGLFEKKSWKAWNPCRSLGFERPDKGSLVLSTFLAILERKGVPFSGADG